MNLAASVRVIGGLVGIISRNGGTAGIVQTVTGWAKDRERGQVATSVLGMFIFFDDYANTLVIGNALRPVTDRLKISREKLAYIVDSTAAPVASIALISTWIGFEVGLTAERRTAETGQLVAEDSSIDPEQLDEELRPKDDAPHRLANAVVPILVLVGVAMGALFVTGTGDTVRDIVGSADAYGALMYGSLLGVLVAAAMSMGQRLLGLREVVEAWFAGIKSVLFVLIILTLAWALSAITDALNTAGEAGLPILYAAVSTILAGAVWGDHCSPISDTTVLSSLASQCDHIDHVRTQVPYALLAGGASVVLGLLPVGFGVPWWLALPASAAAVVAALVWLGRPVVEATDAHTEAAPATA